MRGSALKRARLGSARSKLASHCERQTESWARPYIQCATPKIWKKKKKEKHIEELGRYSSSTNKPRTISRQRHCPFHPLVLTGFDEHESLGNSRKKIDEEKRGSRQQRRHPRQLPRVHAAGLLCPRFLPLLCTRQQERPQPASLAARYECIGIILNLATYHAHTLKWNTSMVDVHLPSLPRVGSLSPEPPV